MRRSGERIEQMNPIHNIYWGKGQKELAAKATPSTLEHRIDHLRALIAKGCGTPSLAAMLADLEQEQKATRIAAGQGELNRVSTQVELTVLEVDEFQDFKTALTQADPDAVYPDALLAARRTAFVGQVKWATR
jgi:hypothetical protein